MISISIVSHAQLHLVHPLLDDIRQHCVADRLEVILTLNLPEELPFNVQDYPFALKVRANTAAKGFAANHDAAFGQAQGEFFCVINPDIRLNGDPFPSLKQCLLEQDVGVAAPLILDENGKIEDSARKFPTPFILLGKALGGGKKIDYPVGDQPFCPDWVGGMFMLFHSSVFKEMGGFDAHYFLYYEDVDLCARLALRGYRVLVCPQVSVVHKAQRASHRNLQYLGWHLSSVTRFFMSRAFWAIKWRQLTGQSKITGGTH